MGSASKTPRRARVIAAVFAIFVAALALRLLYLSQIEDVIFFDNPILDSANYDEKARLIMDGKKTAEGVLTYNPLYPGILSVLYRVVGESDFLAVRIVQCVLGALNCILLVVLGIRFFDFRTGMLAAVLAIFYGPFLFYDGELIQSTWVLFCLLVAFAVFPVDPARRGAWKIGQALLAGLLFGVAFLGRPNLLLFIPFL